MEKTKIGIYKELKDTMENNLKYVKLCHGLSKSKNDGNSDYQRDSRIDKYAFRFTTSKHDSRFPIYLDSYYGYYGDSSVSSFRDSFYMECMVKAINNNMDLIIQETKEIMKFRCEEALIKAKDEADSILMEIEVLGLTK